MSAVRCIALCALMLCAAAGPAQAATVFPMPGSVSASPLTQISFRGVSPDYFMPISVRGSSSGRHDGVLRAHSDGKGVSWVPLRRFRGGERVSVRTQIAVSGARKGDFAFSVAVWPGRVRLQRGVNTVEPGKRRRFESRPDLVPPLLSVDEGSTPAEPGYVFTTPKAKNDTMQAGPMITDLSGRMIWFKPLPGRRAATDFRVQTFRGQPVLTWWEGTSRQGIGSGTAVIAGQDYREIMRVNVPGGYRADLHEFLITPQDTALITTYPVVKADLRAAGGSRRGQLVDSVVQEIDLVTGSTLFEWHSRGQVPLDDSFIAPERSPRVPWDYAHANSISLDSDGDVLVSARNTWAVYKLDRQSGRTEWILGGRRSNFKFGTGARFAWQHDVRRRADGALTIFDNSASPAVAKQSRAIALKVDTGTRTARLLSARVHPRGLLAATQGNYQSFAGGGGLVGWGSQRYLTEYDAAGRLLWDARLSVGYESYRAYRFAWVGRPTTLPKAYARRTSRGMDVFASWNGATEVATWQVLGGSSRRTLAPIGRGERSGFETRVPVNDRSVYAAVRALDAAGNVLAESKAVPVGR
jgi:hypothetical protein